MRFTHTSRGVEPDSSCFVWCRAGGRALRRHDTKRNKRHDTKRHEKTKRYATAPRSPRARTSTTKSLAAPEYPKRTPQVTALASSTAVTLTRHKCRNKACQCRVCGGRVAAPKDGGDAHLAWRLAMGKTLNL